MPQYEIIHLEHDSVELTPVFQDHSGLKESSDGDSSQNNSRRGTAESKSEMMNKQSNFRRESDAHEYELTEQKSQSQNKESKDATAEEISAPASSENKQGKRKSKINKTQQQQKALEDAKQDHHDDASQQDNKTQRRGKKNTNAKKYSQAKEASNNEEKEEEYETAESGDETDEAAIYRAGKEKVSKKGGKKNKGKQGKLHLLIPSTDALHNTCLKNMSIFAEDEADAMIKETKREDDAKEDKKSQYGADEEEEDDSESTDNSEGGDDDENLAQKMVGAITNVGHSLADRVTQVKDYFTSQTLEGDEEEKKMEENADSNDEPADQGRAQKVVDAIGTVSHSVADKVTQVKDYLMGASAKADDQQRDSGNDSESEPNETRVQQVVGAIETVGHSLADKVTQVKDQFTSAFSKDNEEGEEEAGKKEQSENKEEKTPSAEQKEKTSNVDEKNGENDEHNVQHSEHDTETTSSTTSTKKKARKARKARKAAAKRAEAEAVKSGNDEHQGLVAFLNGDVNESAAHALEGYGRNVIE